MFYVHTYRNGIPRNSAINFRRNVFKLATFIQRLTVRPRMTRTEELYRPLPGTKTYNIFTMSDTSSWYLVKKPGRDYGYLLYYNLTQLPALHRKIIKTSALKYICIPIALISSKSFSSMFCLTYLFLFVKFLKDYWCRTIDMSGYLWKKFFSSFQKFFARKKYNIQIYITLAKITVF